jgi:hypothetical protein
MRPPELRLPRGQASGRSAILVTFEVLIDAEGRPDMLTFRVRGTGASENRDALASWIEGSVFAPATQGGRPVPGVFTGRLRVTVQ